MRYPLLITLLWTILPASPQSGPQTVPVYKDPTAPIEARVNDLFLRLTLAEKLSLLSGSGYATVAIPRLGIPAISMSDAGSGVRGGTFGTQGPATAFPGGVDMAATWDPDLVVRIGKAIGEEALNKGAGTQIVLGPDINIHRSPLGGRDGESFSEDPFLTSVMAVSFIRGLQSSGASACVKHFACNNEESDRNFVNVSVSQRALREIYLPGFDAAVRQGGVWSIMCAYNKVGGSYCTASEYLLRDILKGEWGFDGVVMSDWGAVHGTKSTMLGGCDLEMPGGDFLTVKKLRPQLISGAIPTSVVNDSVKRILRMIIRVGLLDRRSMPDRSLVNSGAHRDICYQAASEGMVLLKNDGPALPLDPKSIHSIAVIGPAAVKIQVTPLGSPAVMPAHLITPVAGIASRAGREVKVHYVEGVSLPSQFPDAVPASALTPSSGEAETHGLLGEYFASATLSGRPSTVRIDRQVQTFRGFGRPPAQTTTTRYGSIKWSGTITAPVTGSYTLALMTRAACKLVLNGKAVIFRQKPARGFFERARVNLLTGKRYSLTIEVTGISGPARVRLGWIPPVTDDIPAAVGAAKLSDVAVVFVSTGFTEGEGHDRPSMSLPGNQDRLVDAVAAANPHTIVVINSGSPCLMPWLASVPAVIEAGYPGEECGKAISAILFGDVNPSGKLTDTIAARREDYPDFGHFPGKKGSVVYSEGVYVGYRHFDKSGITPLFEFGYGLSYTTFHYSNLRLTSDSLDPSGKVAVMADITNTGSREGAEVAQLYVHDPSPHVDKPVRELSGFARVDLAPGQTQTVSFPLVPRSLAYYDVPGKRWFADSGTYDLSVGSSSRDLPLSGQVTLTSDYQSAN